MSNPLSVWKYSLAYALMLSGSSLFVLVAGIIGADMAPRGELATLPIALMIVGLASATIPTAKLMGLFSRKPVFIGSGVISVAAALLAAFSLEQENFYMFCIAALLVGGASAAVQQYRFAAIESVQSPELVAKAASSVLVGGILAAWIGPELSTLGKNLLHQDFSGSFLVLSLVYVCGLVVLAFTRNPGGLSFSSEQDQLMRPWNILLKQNNLLIAMLVAVVAYGVMSFIMTATPLSMHNHFHHSLGETKLVIQSHVAAMYLPSLISGFLIARLGYFKMMVLGFSAFLVCLIIAYENPSFWGFWLALVLLGVGWNFLYISATALLTTAYYPSERFRVQGANDMLVFTMQAIASLSSGWLLFRFDWQGILVLSLLPIMVAVVIIVRIRDSARCRAK